MKLLDLSPNFMVVGERPDSLREVNELAGAQGLMFQCPKCAAGLPVEEEDGRRFVRGAHMVLVWFANPRGTTEVSPALLPKPRWAATGSSLADLTLRPSIHITGGCGWHGWVQNGDAG